MNRGFRMAQGELIGWQNSDDLYGPDNFKEGAIASVQFPEYEIYNGATRGFQEWEFRPPWLFEMSEEFSQAGLLERMCVMNQSMFFRRRIFEQGMFIKEEMHYAMDPDFFWRLSLEGFRYKLAPLDDRLLQAASGGKEHKLQLARRFRGLWDFALAMS